MNGEDLGIIVVGGLNTDIVALGVDRLLAPGQQTRSGKLLIGPGGKSCNLARMAAPLIAPRVVAMIGRTSRDPYGLWRVPVDALQAAGVNTDHVKIIDFDATGGYPGIALIAVNRSGENQIYSIPGVNDSLSPRDIDDSPSLFAGAGPMLALTLELPRAAAVHAVRKAASAGMKVMVDPGGISAARDYDELLGLGIYLLKPNEHEARILTGIEVAGMDSAREAARVLMAKGVAAVVLTHGEHGAYVFAGGEERHVEVMRGGENEVRDATGCGDQVMAVLCAETLRGKSIVEASRAAVLAGTMQYHRPGIQPVMRGELDALVREVGPS